MVKTTAIILKGRSGSALPRQLCADAGCWSGTRRQRQRQTDAVPPPDHTQRGCSAPLLRYRHHGDQNPRLSRDCGHAPRWTRTDRPREDGTRTRLRRGFVGPARIRSFPPLIHVNMSSSGKDANYVGPYRLEKTLGKGQTG